VIHPVFGFQSQRPGHARQHSRSAAVVNPKPQGLTPFACR
jgi:hypothetical protein